MKKIIALVLAVMMMAAICVGCGNTAKTDATQATDAATANEAKQVADTQYVKDNGKLVVGITDFAPMDYKDENGEWVGFDADMAKAFAAYLGVDVEFIEIDWDNKIMELNSKTVDCIWNGMTLTEEVTSSMDCSTPYCNNAQVIIVKAADAEKYATADACKDLVFAVEAGSAGEEQATANGFNCTPVKDQATALMEIASGTCDAAIIDSLMAAAMVGEGTSYADLTYTAKLNSEEYGVGFRQGSDLVAEYEKFFADAKADGTVKTIATTYGVQASLID